MHFVLISLQILTDKCISNLHLYQQTLSRGIPEGKELFIPTAGSRDFVGPMPKECSNCSEWWANSYSSFMFVFSVQHEHLKDALQ